MTVSKLLGSRSRTLEARAPARRDSEKIDNENFMKYVQWVPRRARRKKGWMDLRKWNYHYISRVICVELQSG